jgi:energy-coupling factor transporter ATP-binding protein EcfA2
VLLKRPDLVLLDEPFAALDPTGMDQMAALIRGLPGAVIIASHQVERASALCDRGLLLDKGLPRWQGPARDAWAAWKAVHETSPS